ncbi:MAG TPA: PQQ-binding-like beta-propeller repeat protein [Anaeromyxobacteraceae bacterium]|nr:PQQ-binding-like beta-propeller repeat protein [Anaeromyxobacteraceae bacterium]
MLRVRIGEGWLSDPVVREGLRARAPGSRRAAVQAIVDVVALEVDGVDIGSGRTEGPVAEGVLRLLAAVDRLAAGEDHASVPFEDGSVELVLHRQGGQALLTVATLARPARVLAHDVAVELPRLAEAVREAARGFCERVSALSPRGRALPEVRDLLRAAARRTVVAAGSAPPAPGGRLRRTPRRPRDATCSFDFHDEAGRLGSWRGSGGDLASLLVRGRVTLRAPSGAEVLSVEGAPYLVYRDLCAAAGRVAASHGHPVAFDLPGRGPRSTVRVTVAGGEVTTGSGKPVRCDPLALAQAVAEGALDLCAVIRARAPAQAGNALLSDLARSAASLRTQAVEAREGDRASATRRRIRASGSRRPLGAPLSPGSLRRVSFRRIASLDVGPPTGPGLLQAAERVIACGRDAVVALAPTGEPAWRAPGAEGTAAGERAAVLLRGDRLEARDVAGGAVLWKARTPASGASRRSLHLDPSGRLVLVRCGASITAHDAASGERRWTFAPAGAARVSLRAVGPLLLAASDPGMVHALDRDGRIAWRLRGSGPLAAPPLAGARSCLLAFLSPTGATLAGVDPASGRRLFETSLDFAPIAAPVRFAGRIAVPGRVAGEGVLAALEEDGSPAWTASSPAGPHPALAPRPGGLVVKGPDGTCAGLDRDGATAWLRTGPGTAIAPGNLAPSVVRGLVLCPSEEVDVLDAASGAHLGRVPAHAPSRLLAGDDLAVWAVDADGLVTGARVRGHLALLPARPAG